MAVIPQRARLLGQRHLRDAFGEAGIVEIAEIDVLIGLLHQALADKAVGDPRGVQQQILDIDRPPQRRHLEIGLPVGVLAFDADLHAGEAGMYLLTGSSSATLPRSISIIAATLVTVLVSE